MDPAFEEAEAADTGPDRGFAAMWQLHATPEDFDAGAFKRNLSAALDGVNAETYFPAAGSLRAGLMDSKVALTGQPLAVCALAHQHRNGPAVSPALHGPAAAAAATCTVTCMHPHTQAVNII